MQSSSSFWRLIGSPPQLVIKTIVTASALASALKCVHTDWGQAKGSLIRLGDLPVMLGALTFGGAEGSSPRRAHVSKLAPPYKNKHVPLLLKLLIPSVLLSIIDIITILSIPFFLLLINNTWIYAKYANLDEWTYVGYGYDYLDPTFLATNYKISRLPWVLLEALVRGAFPPLISSWILAFGVLALGNIALYFALRIPFGRLPALFAGIFIAGLTFMHANGGADYHNTLAGAFYCFAMLFSARCARQQFSPRDLVFFGASIGLSIHTNPVFINLAPILVAQYLLLYHWQYKEFPPLVPAALSATFGAVAVTLLLGFVNFSLGRQFLFFSEQLKLVSSFIADRSQQKQWWEPWSSFWFLNFPYMGLFFAGTLLSITTLAIAAPRWSRSPRHAHASLYSAAYLCAILIWVFWQSMGQTAFEPSYFAYPLGFPLAGAFAATLAMVVTTEMGPLALTIGSLCFSAATIAGVHETDLVTNFVGAFSWPLGARVALAFSVAFATLILLRQSLWLAPIAAAALCTANALAVYEKLPYIATRCAMSRDAYALILDANSALREMQPRGAKVFVFSDDGEALKSGAECKGWQVPLGWVQGAIAATGFEDVAPYWSKNTLETVQPERWKQMVAMKGLIGFLTYDPARIAVLREKAEEAGGRPGEVRVFKLHAGDVDLPLHIMPLN